MAVLIDRQTGQIFDPSIPTAMALSRRKPDPAQFNTGRNVTGVLGELWDASKLQGLAPEMTPLGSLPNLPIAAKTATNAIGTGAKAGAREIARQIETGTGIFGKGTIDPREYITAYHGTPHEIVGGKFDLSKIGTGEGNQVYSHGLYFAEHPSVAQTYKMPSRGAEATAASTLKMYKTPEKAIEILEDSLSSTLTELGKKHTQEAIDLLKSGKATTGNLYKVDIEDKSLGKMLNWDDPISEQNKFIKNVTKKEIKKIGGSANTGGDFYKEMIFDERMKALRQGLRPTQKELEVLATNRLKNLGISGMKYLDAGSRGNVGSTSNYVVYNPETIKILEKNGLLFP
jgi:hypothetical protein